MLLKIQHTEDINFNKSIQLPPTIIRLYPKSSFYTSLDKFELKITPEPIKAFPLTALDGSTYYQFFFNTSTKSIQIKTTCTVTSKSFNHYDFIIFPSNKETIPFNYSETEKTSLEPFLKPLCSDPDIKHFTDQLLKKSDYKIMSFLINLNKNIFKTIQQKKENTNTFQSPEKTFLTKKGSPHDLVFLFMAITRIAGLASKCVTGYYFNPNQKKQTFHIWCDVYLPKAGWKTFDPCFNVGKTIHHIEVTSSHSHHNINPIEGLDLKNNIHNQTTNIEINII